MAVSNPYFAVEKLKFRHTVTEKLCWSIPLFLAAGASCLARDYVQIDCYNWWYMGILPGFLTLLCCQVIKKEQKLNNQIMMILPVDLTCTWDAKVLYCAKMLVISNLALGMLALAAGFFSELLFGAMQVIELGFIRTLTSCILLSICYLWQIPVCLWLAARIGFVPAFLLNILGNSIGSIALSLTGWWIFCPYAVPARLMCAVIRVLPNGLVAEAGSLTFSPELLELKAVVPGTIVCVGTFQAAWLFTRKWYAETAGNGEGKGAAV